MMCKVTLAYIPATTSSKVTPQPPFSFSALLAGEGLIISNILNKKNAITYPVISFGTNNREIAMPVASSMTICLPSFPNISSPSVADQTLTKKRPMLTGSNIWKEGGIRNQIIGKVMRLAKLPGAKGKYPAKKKVQINLTKGLFFNVIFMSVLNSLMGMTKSTERIIAFQSMKVNKKRRFTRQIHRALVCGLNFCSSGMLSSPTFLVRAGIGFPVRVRRFYILVGSGYPYLILFDLVNTSA